MTEGFLLRCGKLGLAETSGMVPLCEIIFRGGESHDAALPVCPLYPRVEGAGAGKGAGWIARHPHQHPQAKVGEGGEAHVSRNP